MRLHKSFFYIFLLGFIACKKENIVELDENLISYVNPFIGTGGHGHTYPGATMPFGMMQLSPDTRLDGWDGCSGYHYSDDEIYGFSHTHLSGTGVSDYGDVLLMPTNKVVFNNGADGKEGYKSKFSHENEIAEPGYYKVHLEDTNIDVELTVSKRSGMHKYQFPSVENQVVILDLEHRDELNGFNISIINNKEVKGFRYSKAWATDQRLYYYIKFSHPIKNWLREYEVAPKKESFEFINPNNEPIFIKIGISAVDVAGAKKNLEQRLVTKLLMKLRKKFKMFGKNN
jgi:predicted alpha-1,2-mannosidase